MFKDVLDCDFSDISWLFHAVITRHHCAHRAGLDKNGSRIELSVDSIRDLVNMSNTLVRKIEQAVSLIPEDKADEIPQKT
jgi:hypothetical protein